LPPDLALATDERSRNSPGLRREALMGREVVGQGQTSGGHSCNGARKQGRGGWPPWINPGKFVKPLKLI
jgi:hypothetical protein